MLNLFGKVSMDASGFTQAMAKMKATAGPAGAQIGQQIRGKMLEAFGAGAAIALFKSTLQKAMDIKSGATKAGVDSSTFQAMAAVAESAGSSVDELVKIMAEGGDSAIEMADAVAAAKAEMEDTGRIIDGETVNRLSQLGDKLQDLFGKIAPGLAWLVDKVAALYNIIGRGVTAAVAGGQIAFGKVTGDQSMVEAGRSLASEAFGPQQPQSDSAVRTAATIAARIARDERDSTGSGSRQQSKQSRAQEVSSLVAAGAIFNGGASSTNKTLETMNAEVARIRKIIEKGRD